MKFSHTYFALFFFIIFVINFEIVKLKTLKFSLLLSSFKQYFGTAFREGEVYLCVLEKVFKHDLCFSLVKYLSRIRKNCELLIFTTLFFFIYSIQSLVDLFFSHYSENLNRVHFFLLLNLQSLQIQLYTVLTKLVFKMFFDEINHHGV